LIDIDGLVFKTDYRNQVIWMVDNHFAYSE